MVDARRRLSLAYRGHTHARASRSYRGYTRQRNTPGGCCQAAPGSLGL